MSRSTDERRSILFICMGNICRSPLAEGLFLHKINARRVADQFTVDSAGTGGWHAGAQADARMREVATAHGVTLVSRARQITSGDFDRFDLLVCMDEENRHNVLTLGAPRDKVRLLLAYEPELGVREVPDPYYGGQDGFEHVYELVDRACDAMLDDLLATSDAPR